MGRRLVVGLGNPGPQYRTTRHNVGFLVLDRLLSRHAADRSRSKFNAEVFEVRVGGEPWLLLKPQTFMNLSGKSVAAALAWYDLAPEELLVVCDDLNLPLGRLRLRRDGSHGGQKGLEDIIARLGHNAFPRLRVGIAAPPRGNAIDHVLGNFGADEKITMDTALDRAADAVELWGRLGIEAAMNQFNPAPGGKAADPAGTKPDSES